MNGNVQTDIAPSRRLLAEVRRRTRRTQTVRGAAWTFATLAGLVIAAFSLDYLLDLPVVVRGIHLAVSLGAFVAAAAWAFSPLRGTVHDVDVAAAIEKEVPDFEDRLVSALDFEGRIADPEEPESKDLMAETVREASAVAARLHPGLLVDGRPARRALAAAAAGAAVVFALQATLPDALALWFRRGVLLADVSWPRRTVIRVVGAPEQGPFVVTRGDDLRIVAEVEGHRPDELNLHVEELADAAEGEEPRVTWRDLRKMLPVPEHAGQYAFDFRSVSSSFRFWVTGGDDLDDRPSYDVLALVPPRVARFTADVTFPAYAGVPPAKIREAAFDVLAGSKVDLQFEANMPLRSARLLPSNAAAKDLELSPDRVKFTTSFEAATTLEFHLELVAEAGQKNRVEDDLYRIDVVSDRPPSIRVLYPHERLTRTPDGIVPVKVVAEDDFGLADLRLDVRQNTPAAGGAREEKPARASAAATFRIWPADPEPGAPAPEAPATAQKRAHVYRSLDLRKFAGGDGGVQPKAGDVLTLAVSGRDTAGGAAEPREVTVEVVALEELETKLQGQMTRLREDLSSMRRAQRRTVGALRDFRAAAGTAAPDAGTLRRARDLQVDQGRVGADLARFLAGIDRVLDAWVLNRAGSIPTIERLLPLYEEALSAPPEETGDVFPPSLYAKILTEKRANRIYDPDVLGTVLDVMDLGDEVLTVRIPAADGALEKFTGANDASALEPAENAAGEVLAALDRIDERMQRFEDLSELVRIAREIREAQNTLATDPRRKGAEEK